MQNGSGSPPAAAASFPPWVFLHRGGDQHSIVAETKTTAAAACTSTNLLFHVSLRHAAPPANSWLHYDVEGEKSHAFRIVVIAAHGGVLLLEVNSSANPVSYGLANETFDYFLYDTGMLRPPSLLKLPGCYFPRKFMPDMETQRLMMVRETGLLRCGKDDEHLLVVQLEVPYSKEELQDTANLCVLRVGQEWELKRAVPILFGVQPGSTDNVVIPRRWEEDVVVPVGERYLCWVDYLLGFLFCDMAADDQCLKLRYMTLPVVPPKDVEYWDDRPCKKSCRNMAGSGTSMVRFVNIEPRCCCGSHGRSTCTRGQFLFTVTTWTLNLSMDKSLEWVKECMLDCNELWALAAHMGLPQVPAMYPVVSLDNPDVIWFLAMENVQDYAKFTDRRAWMIEVDTRCKAVLSIVRSPDSWTQGSNIAVKLS